MFWENIYYPFTPSEVVVKWNPCLRSNLLSFQHNFLNKYWEEGSSRWLAIWEWCNLRLLCSRTLLWLVLPSTKHMEAKLFPLVLWSRFLLYKVMGLLLAVFSAFFSLLVKIILVVWIRNYRFLWTNREGLCLAQLFGVSAFVSLGCQDMACDHISEIFFSL